MNGRICQAKSLSSNKRELIKIIKSLVDTQSPDLWFGTTWFLWAVYGGIVLSGRRIRQSGRTDILVCPDLVAQVDTVLVVKLIFIIKWYFVFQNSLYHY